uniref:Uncharacterized protein n=1 Tax=Romanomermis culicivorax TaxID=13658 RepID=A0A915K8G3_ROMCU
MFLLVQKSPPRIDRCVRQGVLPQISKITLNVDNGNNFRTFSINVAMKLSNGSMQPRCIHCGIICFGSVKPIVKSDQEQSSDFENVTDNKSSRSNLTNKFRVSQPIDSDTKAVHTSTESMLRRSIFEPNDVPERLRCV